MYTYIPFFGTPSLSFQLYSYCLHEAGWLIAGGKRGPVLGRVAYREVVEMLEVVVGILGEKREDAYLQTIHCRPQNRLLKKLGTDVCTERIICMIQLVQYHQPPKQTLFFPHYSP